MVEQTSARKMLTSDRSPATHSCYRAHWELPPVTSSTFARSAPRAWRQRGKRGTAKPWVTAPTNQRATLTDLQSVWSGSKDLLADMAGLENGIPRSCC